MSTDFGADFIARQKMMGGVRPEFTAIIEQMEEMDLTVAELRELLNFLDLNAMRRLIDEAAPEHEGALTTALNLVQKAEEHIYRSYQVRP